MSRPEMPCPRWSMMNTLTPHDRMSSTTSAYFSIVSFQPVRSTTAGADAGRLATMKSLYAIFTPRRPSKNCVGCESKRAEHWPRAFLREGGSAQCLKWGGHGHEGSPADSIAKGRGAKASR